MVYIIFLASGNSIGPLVSGFVITSMYHYSYVPNTLTDVSPRPQLEVVLLDIDHLLCHQLCFRLFPRTGDSPWAKLQLEPNHSRVGRGREECNWCHCNRVQCCFEWKFNIPRQKILHEFAQSLVRHYSRSQLLEHLYPAISSHGLSCRVLGIFELWVFQNPSRFAPRFVDEYI